MLSVFALASLSLSACHNSSSGSSSAPGPAVVGPADISGNWLSNDVQPQSESGEQHSVQVQFSVGQMTETKSCSFADGVNLVATVTVAFTRC